MIRVQVVEIPAIGIALTVVKDTAYSPLEAHGQAFSEGVNLVISQLQHGLMWDECCVALLLSNGELRLLNPQVSKVGSL